jgi:hypothetical protein
VSKKDSAKAQADLTVIRASRLLNELGHELIVAHARNVRLIGRSRRKDDRLDAQTLADPKGEALHRQRTLKSGASPAPSVSLQYPKHWTLVQLTYNRCLSRERHIHGQLFSIAKSRQDKG